MLIDRFRPQTIATLPNIQANALLLTRNLKTLQTKTKQKPRKIPTPFYPEKKILHASANQQISLPPQMFFAPHLFFLRWPDRRRGGRRGAARLAEDFGQRLHGQRGAALPKSQVAPIFPGMGKGSESGERVNWCIAFWSGKVCMWWWRW